MTRPAEAVRKDKETSKETLDRLRPFEVLPECDHTKRTPYASPGYDDFVIECKDCGMVRRLGDWEVA